MKMLVVIHEDTLAVLYHHASISHYPSSFILFAVLGTTVTLFISCTRCPTFYGLNSIELIARLWKNEPNLQRTTNGWERQCPMRIFLLQPNTLTGFDLLLSQKLSRNNSHSKLQSACRTERACVLGFATTNALVGAKEQLQTPLQKKTLNGVFKSLSNLHVAIKWKI